MYSVLAITLSLLAVCNAVELTEDNWDVETAGKTLFVNFYSSSCSACKKFKPRWETLEREFVDSETVLIGGVDCDGEGVTLCNKHDIKGYPTLKYGDPFDLKPYEGEGRPFTMYTFATELKPMCSPANVDLCDTERKAVIEKYQAMSAEELDSAINDEIKELDAANEILQNARDEHKDRVQKLQDKKDATIKEINQNGLDLMKAIKVSKV